MDNWNRPKIAKYATDRIACGEMAGRWLFGDKAFQNGQVTLINNAIQAEKFSFSEKDRDSLRKELGWENKTVIGHVGRFDIPKNHDRMLDIFQQIVSEKRCDAVSGRSKGRSVQRDKRENSAERTGR